jgi:hypothetical protein
MTFRTDNNNNPTAFTTDIAREAELVLGTDYEVGESFTIETSNKIYYTAKLLKDPIATTIQVIDKIGFFNDVGQQRWIYIGIPYKLWSSLTKIQKEWVIGYMYHQEGGDTMTNLFPHEPTLNADYKTCLNRRQINNLKKDF